MEEMKSQDDRDFLSLEQQWSPPHEAIFFVLPYLPVFELLSMSQVCKSLRDAVKNDIIPWLKLIVDHPSLCYRLTDDTLMEVASKGKGRIQLLALINCVNVTDSGLLRVISSNPRIKKVHLQGCRSLTPGAVIKAATFLKLKSLSISGIPFIDTEHLKTLHQLMETERTHTETKIFYHEYIKLSAVERASTDHQIDVDTCPECQEVRMVFDCCRATCGMKCRGCVFCTDRCIECGVCLRGNDDEETQEVCCEDAMCLECWIKQPKCSFCNKPYCTRHTDLKIPGSSGFLCQSCHFSFN